MHVSVVCPVYNTPPALLHAAAHSVLGETGHVVAELLLIDDASTALDTKKALDELAHQPRVRLLRAPVDGGPACARNFGLAEATGDWIGFLDADDLWTSNHLTAVQSILSARPEVAWIAANHETLGRDGTRTPSALLSEAHPGVRLASDLVLYQGPAATRALIGNYWLHLGGTLLRTDVARAAGGFSSHCLYSEDWLFFLCVSTLTDLYYLEASTYVLRRQHASLTTSDRRLSIRRADGKRAALKHPMLRPFSRELRWALHSTWKGLAANNLLAGKHLRAVNFATRAYMMDPRAVHEFGRFLRLALSRRRLLLTTHLRGYTQAELLSSDLAA